MRIKERIRKFDADIFGFCRACAVLNLTMDAALTGMDAQGFSREAMLSSCGAVWMAAHFKYELARPLLVEDELEIDVSPLRAEAAHVMTEMELSVRGEPAGRAEGAWLIVDAGARRILRPCSIEGIEAAAAVKRDRFMRRIVPPEGAGEYRRPVRYSDCDINGHFNSPRYADCICDAHGYERLAPSFISELQISFSAESKPGDELLLRTWRNEDGLCMTHASCEGKTRFTAYFRSMEHERVL